MALPDNISTSLVTGSYLSFDGEPATGEVWFYPTVSELMNIDGVCILRENDPIVGVLVEGELSVELPATDDPDLTPTGWGYVVFEKFDNRRNDARYAIFAPAAGVDLPNASPVVPVDELASVVLTVNGNPPDPAGNVEVTTAVAEVEWVDVLNKPSTFAPAAHTHTVANVTGLQTALDGKAASSHTHTAGQVSGLATVATSGAYADLTGTPSAVNLADTPRYVHFDVTWPARPSGARMVFYIGGDSVANPPVDAVAGDVWIPES